MRPSPRPMKRWRHCTRYIQCLQRFFNWVVFICPARPLWIFKGCMGRVEGGGHFLFCDYCPTMPQQQLYVGLYSCCNLSLSHTHTHTHTHTHIYIRISLYPLLFHSVSIYYNLSRLIHFFSGFLFAYWFLFLWGILGSPLVFYCGSFWLIGWLGFSFSFWVILLLPN